MMSPVTASHELERLTIQAKEVVKLMREESGPKMSYALAYELRTRLGYIVRELGYGPPDSATMAAARELLDKQTDDDFIWRKFPREELIRHLES